MKTATGRVVAVSAGTAGPLTFDGKTDRSAFVKAPLVGPVAVGPLGIEGDEHVFAAHGGPDQALLVYSQDHYPSWRSRGYDLPEVAAFGENLTVAGLTEDLVHLGDTFQIGSVTARVTCPRIPCYKIGYRYGDPGLPVAMQDALNPGYMLGVVEPGTLAAGDEMRLIDRGAGSVTVAEAARVVARDRDDWEGVAGVAAVPALAEAMRRQLLARLERRTLGDDRLRLFGPQ